MTERRIPQRRCIGCMVSKNQNELIRIAYKDGQIAVDISGSAPGRGAYICKNIDCLDLARKKHAIERVTKGKIKPDDAAMCIEEVEEFIRKGFDESE